MEQDAQPAPVGLDRRAQVKELSAELREVLGLRRVCGGQPKVAFGPGDVAIAYEIAEEGAEMGVNDLRQLDPRALGEGLGKRQVGHRRS